MMINRFINSGDLHSLHCLESHFLRYDVQPGRLVAEAWKELRSNTKKVLFQVCGDVCSQRKTFCPLIFLIN